MTTQEIQTRNERAQKLRVIQYSNNSYYVESADGMICYKVHIVNNNLSCTCGDYIKHSKNDPNFKCKHILAVLECDIEAGEMEIATFLEKKRPKLDERFIKVIEGREFVLYSGLLDLGHQKGILSIEVEPLQYPHKDNGYLAICKAKVISKSGETYGDVGDANPENCNSRVSKHLLRMASTRAIARALRTFTNIGMTCLEELGDFKEVLGENSNLEKAKVQRKFPKKTEKETKPEIKSVPKPEEKPKEIPQAKPTKEKPKEDIPKQAAKTEEPTFKMSEAQKRAIHNLSRRRGIAIEEMDKIVLDMYKVPLDNLTAKDASAFIRTLQQAA
ncbi:MAG: SWIM zinc finger family protein [bacterium]